MTSTAGSASQHFASFAAYTPPPDDPAALAQRQRPWFPSTPAAAPTGSMSYQAGGIPTFATAAGSSSAALADESANPNNMWETRFGWRVDVLAAVAYLAGPFSALALLILETHNDYVRFHAYQSALVSSPLLLLLLFEHLLHFWTFLTVLTTILLVVVSLYLAFRAYQDAAIGDLARFQVPYAGELADRWVSDE